MAEFNLIPERYILWRKFVTDLRSFFIVFTVFVILGGVGHFLLQREIKTETGKISQMRKTKADLDSQHAEIRDLQDNKHLLQARFNLVKGLKGNLAASDLFLAMDDALSDDIEFESWSFKRSGQPAKKGSREPGSSSYFIIVDELTDSESGVDGLQISAEINLIGRALSHSAMAEFMRKLSKQDIVERVELVRSAGNRDDSSTTVEFEFLVELVTGEKLSD